MRTTLGKALAQWRADLVADLGGRDAISTQRAAIIDLAVKTKLLLDSIDAWSLTQPVSLEHGTVRRHRLAYATPSRR